jgi:hypothetical protein
VEFACGSNGGPPRQPLRDWTGFAECPPDDNGLHEVYVQFDDHLEYWARARTEFIPEFGVNQSGTRIAGHRAIVSVLVNEQGIVDGIRVVTDPRTEVQDRRLAYLLGDLVKRRYGQEGWECVDRPPEGGQSPVGGIFINERCEKLLDETRRLVVETHFFRKPGQTGVDEQGQWKPGDYESSTRFEILNPEIPTL